MNGKWKWLAPLIVSVVTGTLSLVAYYGGVQHGHDEKVAQAAVDQKRLADVEAKAQAVETRMGERIVVDTMQNGRLDAAEKHHEEALEAIRGLTDRVNDLVEIMWKDEIRRQDRARKPGE